MGDNPAENPIENVLGLLPLSNDTNPDEYEWPGGKYLVFAQEIHQKLCEQIWDDYLRKSFNNLEVGVVHNSSVASEHST